MAAKRRGYSSVLSYSDDSGANYTALSDCKMIDPPDMERGPVDITHLTSVEDWDESMPGHKKSSEIKVELYFTEAQFDTVMDMLNTDPADYDSETPQLWKITLPLIVGQVTAAILVTAGWLQKIELSALTVEDNAFMLPLTIKCTSKPTFTVGA